jgi:hypothetical protein
VRGLLIRNWLTVHEGVTIYAVHFTNFQSMEKSFAPKTNKLRDGKFPLLQMPKMQFQIQGVAIIAAACTAVGKFMLIDDFHLVQLGHEYE